MRAGGRGAARRVRSRAFWRCAADPSAARGVCAARAGRREHVGGSRWERDMEDPRPGRVAEPRHPSSLVSLYKWIFDIICFSLQFTKKGHEVATSTQSVGEGAAKTEAKTCLAPSGLPSW